MQKKKILFIVGTRPDALKLAPLILKARHDKRFKVRVCLTAQHREMADQVLRLFGIKPNVDLNLMRENQDLSCLTGRLLDRMKQLFIKFKPDMAVVQGDTTTSFGAALEAFYHRTILIHVEAGLRSFDKF